MIEAKLGPQAFHVLDRSLLPQHVVDRVADKAKHRECDQPDDQQHENCLADPSDDVGQHLRLRDERAGSGAELRRIRPRVRHCPAPLDMSDQLTVTHRRMKKLSGRCVSSMLLRVPQTSGCT